MYGEKERKKMEKHSHVSGLVGGGALQRDKS